MASNGTRHNRLLPLHHVRSVPDEPNDPIVGFADAHASVGVAGAFVIVTARYGGGSNEHDFHAYWDGSMTRRNPPDIVIHLRHDAKGDAAEAMLETTLQIDVGVIYDTQKEFSVTVRTAEADSEPVVVRHAG